MASYRLTLVADLPNDRSIYEHFEFEAFPAASCTLAQHYAAKAWYALQERLEQDSPPPKEPAE